MNRIAASLAAVTISLGAPLAAQEHSLDTTFTVRGTPRVSVNNLSGTIVVTSGNRSAVRLQAEYDDARVEADVSPSRVAVRTVSRGGDNEVTYTLTVPVGTSLELSGNSTDIDVRGVCGEASISITSGDLTLAWGGGGARGASGGAGRGRGPGRHGGPAGGGGLFVLGAPAGRLRGARHQCVQRVRH